jgi:nucleotide-binding universal stress UspA family protein
MRRDLPEEVKIMKVLIATDGSQYSMTAVKKCCKFLGGLKTVEFKIVSVFEDVYVMSGEPFSISDDYYMKLLEAVEGQANKFVVDAEDVILKKFGHKARVSWSVVKGNPDEQIVELAREWGADLIVVGSHGRGFWGRLIGSVSDAVVHHAPCSVLVVRPRQTNDAENGLLP